jgi:hypothetical protein
MIRSITRTKLCITWLALFAVACGGGGEATQPAPTPQTGSSGGTQATPVATPPDAGEPAAVSTDGGQASTQDAAAAPAQAELPAMPEGLHGPSRPWAQMNHQQRARYMGEAVMPAMTTLFHAYDSTRYAQVTCATCHGTNARQVNFRMPNRLPTLPAFGTPEAQHAMEENPRIYQFMGQRVVPAMSQILGVEPFNMQTHQGFGCANCHPHGHT